MLRNKKEGLTMISADISPAMKAIVVFLIGLFLSAPVSTAFAATYNWYGSNFAFDSNLTGSTRYYDLDNIGIEFTSYSSPQNSVNPYMFVTLVRDNLLIDDWLERKTGYRDGYNHFDWYGVGAGSYYFYFSKAIDGAWVYSDRVEMFSW